MKTYPYFIACDEKEWGELNAQATEFLLKQYGYTGGDNYSTPFIDENGIWFFIVSPEIEHIIPDDERIPFYYENIALKSS